MNCEKWKRQKPTSNVIHTHTPDDLVDLFLQERKRARSDSDDDDERSSQAGQEDEDEEEEDGEEVSSDSELESEDEAELEGADAAFIREIKRTLTVEECRLIVLNAFEYFERVYRWRRREKRPPREGEQPLFPESIPFTRKLHRAVIGLSLPVILGQEAFDNYGQQLASEFDLITGYKAAILIMARGNGKTMGMIDIIPFMILFQRKVSRFEIFITTPGQTLVKGILDQIKEQITVHVKSHPDVDFVGERPITANASSFEWALTDGRSFLVQCHPATDNQVRGQHPHLLIVDEARKVDEIVMKEAIGPIITDAGSLVFYISTPAAAGHHFDTAVRSALAELRDDKCANPVMYPLLMTLVCEKHQNSDVPSKCRCGLPFLQPWKSIHTIRPVIDQKIKENDISALECEVLGLPPTFEGACYNPAHITAFERADPTELPPAYNHPIIFVSIDPTLNGEKSDFSIVSCIRTDRDDTTGATFAIVGATRTHISVGGVQPSVEALIRHLEALAALPFAKDCQLALTIEGQNKSVAQTLLIGIRQWFGGFYPVTSRSPPFRLTENRPFFFVNAWNKPDTPDNEFYYPTDHSRIRGMLAIQKGIETISILRHTHMFFEGPTEASAEDMWRTLGTQLRNIRMTQPKNKITGKNSDKDMGRDDLHMALSNLMEAMKVIPAWFIPPSKASRLAAHKQH